MEAEHIAQASRVVEREGGGEGLGEATLYLPQNSHHTYLHWHFHSHSEIYCHATSTIQSHDLCVHHHIALHDIIELT